MIALEQLGTGSVTDRNFQALMALVPDTGGRSIGIRYGVVTVTWPGAATTSNPLVVPHGLGRTPVIVIAGTNSLAGSAFTYAVCGVIGTTTFQVQLATTSSPAAPSPTVTSWIAIG